MQILKLSLGSCGKKVTINKCSFFGIQNVYVGSNVFMGGGSTTILSTRAKVYIGNHVMFGPNVTLVTGNHRFDIPGRYMDSITDKEKLPENDQDIHIEDDVWIGANSIILKGITVHSGSIIAAGSVVTKDVPTNSIVAGNPARIIKKRFSDSDYHIHIKRLSNL